VTPTRIEILERDKHRTKSDILERGRPRVGSAKSHGAFRPLIVSEQYFELPIRDAECGFITVTP
jgi:hypothetical protein